MLGSMQQNLRASLHNPLAPNSSQPQKSKMPSAAFINHGNEGFEERRFQQLEIRLSQTEQSNRALLEELMRLQNEFKSFSARSSNNIDEERQMRRQLEQNNQSLQNRLSDVEEKWRRSEQALNETKSALTQLVSHTRSVEKAVTNSQQELLNKKDQSLSRVNELKQEIVHHVQAKDQSERLLYTLRDEIHQLASRVEVHNLEITRLGTSVGLQARIAEDIAKRGLNVSRQDITTAQKLDTTVIELKHLCMEMQRQLDNQTKTRDMAEQSLSNRIGDLTNLVTDQNRKREEMIRILELRHRDLTSISDAERQKLRYRIEETMDTLNHDVSGRENRLKEDFNERFRKLEKQITTDRQNKVHERNLKEDLERRIFSTRKALEDDITAVHNKLENETKNTDTKLRGLNKATTILDQQIQAVRDHSDQLIRAEIKSRKSGEKDLHHRMDECLDKLRMGMASVTDAIGSVRRNPNDTNTDIKIDMLKVHEISQDKADEVRNSLSKDLKSLGSKVNNMDERMTKQEKETTQKLNQIAATNNGNAVDPELKGKLETLTFSHERLKRQADETQNDLRRLPREITDLDTRVERLEKTRRSAQSGKANAQMAARLQTQMDTTQTSIRKLAESVHVVKNVLSDKIKEETAVRSKQTTILRSEVQKLKAEMKKIDY